MRKLFTTLGGLAVALAVLGNAVAGQPISPAKSSIVAQFSQMSVPVKAPFRHFTGTIAFDPAHPERAQARIDIDMSSFDIGEDDYNAEIRKPEWFSSEKYPKASFVAHGLKPQGGSKYLTSGVLSLKGKQQTLNVPVTVKMRADGTTFEGAVPIDRTYFNIGGPDWQGTVADQVMIHFHIVVPNAG